MHVSIIHAKIVCLSSWDVVNPLFVIATADAIERMRYSTLLPCAKTRARDSEPVGVEIISAGVRRYC